MARSWQLSVILIPALTTDAKDCAARAHEAMFNADAVVYDSVLNVINTT